MIVSNILIWWIYLLLAVLAWCTAEYSLQATSKKYSAIPNTKMSYKLFIIKPLYFISILYQAGKVKQINREVVCNRFFLILRFFLQLYKITNCLNNHTIFPDICIWFAPYCWSWIIEGLHVKQFKRNQANNFKSSSCYGLSQFEITYLANNWIARHSLNLPF